MKFWQNKSGGKTLIMNNSIENQIARLEQELATLKQLVNKPKEKWQPQSYTGHRYLLDIAKCSLEAQNNRGLVYYNATNALQKTDEVIQFTRMMKFAHERNGHWEFNWDNASELKYYVAFGFVANKWFVESTSTVMPANLIYFKSKSDAIELADLLNNGLF